MISLKAFVDKGTCIACGMCASICPEVFEIEDDGKAALIVDEVSDKNEHACIEATDNCPVGAITTK